VFGTNIKLHTEEDIAKWIADRKARFPSKKRVEEKVHLNPVPYLAAEWD
jgi:ribosome assembly protein 1